LSNRETARLPIDAVRRVVLRGFVVILLLATPTLAQSNFQKGDWVLHLWPSYVNGEAGFHGDEVEAVTSNVGVGYYFDDDWGIYADLNGYAFEQRGLFDHDAEGPGLSLLLRWHVLNRERFSLYIDGGGGLVRFDEEFPAQGTHNNFTARVGAGASYQVADDLHLIGGVRYFHLSNAARKGMDENPSLDAVELYLGVLIEF
jgi:opacity protein-like surface antigen